MWNAGVYQVAFAVFVRAKEDDGAGERSQESRSNSAIQTAPDAFLTNDGGVCGGQRGVLGRYARVALLPCLDRVYRMHQEIPGRASDPTSQH